MSSGPSLSCEQWISLAQHSNGEKRYQQALEALNHAQALGPNDVEVYLTRCATYLFLKEYGKAVKAAGEALACHDLQERYFNQLKAYYLRALGYLRLQDYQHARDDCNIFIQRLPEVNRGYRGSYLWDTYLARGEAYAGLGDYKRAIADFNKADEIRPDRDNPYKLSDTALHIYYHRGNAYLALGRYQEAFRDLDFVHTFHKPDNYDTDFAQHNIDQETLQRNWEQARRLIEEGKTSGGEEESVSEDRPRKRWWQWLLFWK